MHQKFDDLGRFADPSLLILTSLADGPRHGYAIMTDIAAFSGVKIEPGTMYGALTRLERRGWVRPLAADDRRRPYEITELGRAVLAEQLASMARITAVGQRRLVKNFTAQAQARARVAAWIDEYNCDRKHSACGAGWRQSRARSGSTSTNQDPPNGSLYGTRGLPVSQPATNRA